MKKMLRTTIGIIMFAGTSVATFAAEAQTTAAGPYYATPSWDQSLPAATRFIVLSNLASAAVLDRETGLVWEKVPNQFPMAWNEASVHCAQLQLGGRYGWKLPTIQDLASLLDPTASNPPLPSGHPFTLSGVWYWSATTSAVEPTNAWILDLIDQAPVAVTAKFFAPPRPVPVYAWCVRGGQSAESQ